MDKVINISHVTSISKYFNPKIDKKVDVVEGKELVSTTDIAQISTNKAQIESLESELASKIDSSALTPYATTETVNEIDTRLSDVESKYVEKVAGKELIESTKIEQIDTNKASIETLNEQISSKIDESALTPYAKSETVQGLITRIESLEQTLQGLDEMLTNLV